MSAVESPKRDLVQEIADFIAVHEGCHKCKGNLIYPYICPAGYWTQGYGLLVKKDSPPITREEALRRFKQVIPLYINHVLKYSPHLANHPDRLIAITSFVFNLGPTAYAGSTLRKKIDKEDWTGAKRELNKWVNGGGRKLGGLVKRRAAEGALL